MRLKFNDFIVSFESNYVPLECNEYKEAVFETQYVRNPFGNAPIQKKVSTCGFESKPFIVGGTVASSKEFPHMVSLNLIIIVT